MSKLPKIGDWGYITGSYRIGKVMWHSSYPNNIFGKVIDISVRYSPIDGRRLPAVITMRCYFKNARYHMKTVKEFYRPIEKKINNLYVTRLRFRSGKR